VGKRTIENINRLIRQYIPKRIDFRGHKGKDSKCHGEINNRPPKEPIYEAHRHD
jgi:IS30 family transposase